MPTIVIDVYPAPLSIYFRLKSFQGLPFQTTVCYANVVGPGARRKIACRPRLRVSYSVFLFLNISIG